MLLPLYQVDAFTDRVFGGNPAAVVPLEQWLPDATLQAIATENNLSETAFFLRQGEDFALRWFTPVAEIDLAGHPTLATAYVVFRFFAPERTRLTFHTPQAGALIVSRRGDELAMDFPARPPQPCTVPPALAAALGKPPLTVLAARDYMAVYATAADVADLKPDFGALARLDRAIVIVTAPGGGDADFVSRCFAPAHNINEDPVTGSAHCTLIPYWAERLGKPALKARQISARVGELSCALAGERVIIAGRCALYLEGTISI